MIILKPQITETHLDALRKVESNDGDPRYLLSHAGAEGPYQIMPFMQKAYGLVDPYNEEEARKAARRILQDELDALGTLELAFAAYNAGRPRVANAVKKARSASWDRVRRHLPVETQQYVPKIAKHIQRPWTDASEDTPASRPSASLVQRLVEPILKALP